jgi:hypothetical protein
MVVIQMVVIQMVVIQMVVIQMVSLPIGGDDDGRAPGQRLG